MAHLRIAGADASLTLTNPQPTSGREPVKRVDALLSWEDGQARLVIDLDQYVDDGERLVSYLESLSSAYWTGWSGVREWDSIERTLSIHATWRHTGSAHLLVQLKPAMGEWRAAATLQVENTELESMGPQTRAFLRRENQGMPERPEVDSV